VNLTNQIKTNAVDDVTIRRNQQRRNQRARKMTRRRQRMMTRRNKIKEGKRKDTNIETLLLKMMRV